MSEQKYALDDTDQQRIVIALGIVATDIAILTIPRSHELASSIVGALFFVPAAFSFLFTILTGAHLKFKRPGDIGELQCLIVSDKCYTTWQSIRIGGR